jgi:hypothetical protein
MTTPGSGGALIARHCWSDTVKGAPVTARRSAGLAIRLVGAYTPDVAGARKVSMLFN